MTLCLPPHVGFSLPKLAMKADSPCAHCMWLAEAMCIYQS